MDSNNFFNQSEPQEPDEGVFTRFVKYKLRAFRRVTLLPWSSISFIFFKLESYLLKRTQVIYDNIYFEFPEYEYASFLSIVLTGFVDVIVTVIAAGFLTIFVVEFPMSALDSLLSFFSWYFSEPLLFTLFSPLFSAIVIICLPERRLKATIFDTLSLGVLLSFFVLLCALGLVCLADLSSLDFQFQYRLRAFDIYDDGYEPRFLGLVIGVDGLSITLLLLTAFLFSVSFLFNHLSVKSAEKQVTALFFLLEFFIFFAFSSLDLISFFLFFEATLLPLFLIIGLLGSRERKTSAAYKLFFFTFTSSAFTFLGIVLLTAALSGGEFAHFINSSLAVDFQYLLWLLFFISFATKLPVVPVHIWLPEAHVEAPTSGSMILAGVLLKLGGYGFFRFLVQLFPDASCYFTPLVLLISILGLLYSSLLAIRQVDIKKVIAYSSIAHMAFVSVGFVTFDTVGFAGGIFIMFSHGLISAALFALVGMLYDRYKTKLIVYFSSLATVMPVFSTLFLFFVLGNIGMPGTSGFFGEFLALLGVSNVSYFILVVMASSVVLSAAFTMWLYNRVVFGKVNTKYITLYQDLSLQEFLCLVILLIPMVIFGIVPDLLLENFENYSEVIYMQVLLKRGFF